MTKLSRSIFFVSFREKIKSGYDVEIVISNFFTALYFDTGPSPHSVQIIIHLRFYLSTNNRLPFQKPPCTFSSYNATIRASEKYPILSSGNSFLIDEQYGFLPRPVRPLYPDRESLYELLPILLQPHIDPFRKIRTYADFIVLQVTSIGRIPNARSIEVSIHR